MVFADGSSALTVDSPDDALLPDWTVLDIDRPTRIMNWNTAEDGTGTAYYPGYAMPDGVTLYAQAETGDPWPVPSGVDNPFVLLICYTVSLGGGVADSTGGIAEYVRNVSQELTSLPVVNVAENEGGTIRFSLIRILQKDFYNPLSPTWPMAPNFNDDNAYYPKAVAPGMYVWLGIQSPDGTAHRIADGAISTVTAYDDHVDVTAGDGNSFASKQGTYVRRNYYGTSISLSPYLAVQGTDSYYMDLSTLGYSSVLSAVLLTKGTYTPSGTSQVQIFRKSNNQGKTEFDETIQVARMTMSRFHGTVTIPDTWRVHLYTGSLLGEAEAEYTAELTVTIGSESRTVTISDSDASGGADRSKTFPSMDFGTEYYAKSARVYVTLHIYGYVQGIIADAIVDAYADRVSGAYTAPNLTFGQYTETAIGTDYTLSNGILTPTDQTSAGNADHGYVRYSSGDAYTGSVMAGVGRALGDIPVVSSSSVALAAYRTGGGYALDYLQKAADLGQHAFRRVGRSPLLLIGSRKVPYTTAEAGLRVVRGDNDGAGYDGMTSYGGLDDSGLKTVMYSEFSYQQTKKNVAELHMVRGTASASGSSDTRAIQAAVTDTGRGWMLEKGYDPWRTESVSSDSSISEETVAVKTAYADSVDSSSSGIKGTVTLPGIVAEVMDLWGDGNLIAMYDLPNGMQGARMKPYEVTWDWGSCTTTVEVGDYDVTRASSISETAVSAKTSSDLSVSSSSEASSYNSQFVFAQTDEWVPTDSGNAVSVYNGSAWIALSDVTVAKLPQVWPRRWVVTGWAKATASSTCSVAYGVTQLKLTNGDSESVTIPIRPALRPDFWEGQVLNVCVEVYSETVG